MTAEVIPFRKMTCCSCGEEATRSLAVEIEEGFMDVKWFCDDCYPIIERKS